MSLSLLKMGFADMQPFKDTRIARTIGCKELFRVPTRSDRDKYRDKKGELEVSTAEIFETEWVVGGVDVG